MKEAISSRSRQYKYTSSICISNACLCIAVVLSCLLKSCQAWSLGGAAPDVDTAAKATATRRRRLMENTFVDTKRKLNVDRNIRVELDSECSLDGLVERIYDSNLDQYVYRDVQQDETKIEIEDASHSTDNENPEGKTRTPNARLYRKCNCYQVENKNNTSDNVFDRKSNSNVQDATTIITTTTANNSNADNHIQSMTMLCPIEAQTCAILYKNNIDKNTNNTIQQTAPSTRSLLHQQHPHETYYYHQGTTDIAQCYIVTPKAAAIRYYGSILQFWFALLGIALVFTERGRQAIRFGIIKIWGLLFWFQCCFSVCCLGVSNPNNNDSALAYNTPLAERILRREALVREIRRDQWETPGMGLGPERDASELAYRSPIGDWWLIYRWRRSTRDDNQQQHSSSSSSSNTANSSNSDEDEEQASSSSNNSTINSTSMMANNYREMRRKYGIHELFIRTKIYRKDENSGSEQFGGDDDGDGDGDGDGDDDIVDNHDDHDDDHGNDNGSHRTASKNCAGCSDSDGATDDNEVVCTICFGTIEDGDKIGNLDCNHLFHSSCLKTWIKRKNTCPVCLKPIALVSSNPY